MLDVIKEEARSIFWMLAIFMSQNQRNITEVGQVVVIHFIFRLISNILISPTPSPPYPLPLVITPSNLYTIPPSYTIPSALMCTQASEITQKAAKTQDIKQ